MSIRVAGWIPPFSVFIFGVRGLREFSVGVDLFFLLLIIIGYGLIVCTCQPLRTVFHVVVAGNKGMSAFDLLVEFLEVVEGVLSIGHIHRSVIDKGSRIYEVFRDIRRPELFAGIEVDQRRMVEHILRDILQNPWISIPLAWGCFLAIVNYLLPIYVFRTDTSIPQEELVLSLVLQWLSISVPGLRRRVRTVMGKSAKAQPPTRLPVYPIFRCSNPHIVFSLLFRLLRVGVEMRVQRRQRKITEDKEDHDDQRPPEVVHHGIGFLDSHV